MLQERIVVPRPVADCFRYLRDFSTIEQWDGGVVAARKVTPGPVGPGSEFALQLRIAGRPIEMDYHIRELEADRRIVLEGTAETFSALDTLELVRCRAGETEIRYRAELNLPPAARLLQPLLARYGRDAVAGLGRALTPEPLRPAGTAPLRLRHRLLLPAARDFTRRGYLRMPNKGLSEFIDGRTVVLTGASGGLGLAAACELGRLGARLLLVGRDRQRMAAAVEKVMDFSGGQAPAPRVYLADLSLLRDARRVAAEIRADVERIDVLINNAGALYAEHALTEEGHERALAINALVPAQLFQALRPALSGGQVINVLSGGLYLQGLRLADMNFEQESYDGAKAYARAKRALLALGEGWAGAFEDHGVRVNAMHPGWADTPGVQSALPGFRRRMAGRLRDSRMGADTIVWLASASAAQAANGQFWFDRQAQPTAVLPGTAHRPDQCAALRRWVAERIDE